jgi:hypothetical protein
MIIVENFAKSWWCVAILMAIIIMVELCLADYMDYAPDSLTDISFELSR